MGGDQSQSASRRAPGPLPQVRSPTHSGQFAHAVLPLISPNDPCIEHEPECDIPCPKPHRQHMFWHSGLLRVVRTWCAFIWSQTHISIRSLVHRYMSNLNIRSVARFSKISSERKCLSRVAISGFKAWHERLVRHGRQIVDLYMSSSIISQAVSVYPQR